MKAINARATAARFAAGLAACLASPLALADYEPKDWQLNMTRGVTGTAANAYDMHMLML